MIKLRNDSFLSIFIFILTQYQIVLVLRDNNKSLSIIINLGENPTISTMFNFFKQMKQKLGSSLNSQQPTYRQYTHAELKIIAMRTRMILQQFYKKEKMKVGQKDSQFKKLQTSQMGVDKQYEVLQQIGRKVVEVQSIKLLIEMLRKIEAYSPQIINTKGDIALMKQQLSWFQCILWYRRCKKLTSIEEFNTFCFNFFKGVDITQELNVKCELFKVYEEFKYLGDTEVLPMDYLVGKVVGEVSFQITEEELEEMRDINKKEIKEREMIKKQQEMKNVNPFLQYNNQLQQQQQQYINPQQQHFINPQQQQYNMNEYANQLNPYNPNNFSPLIPQLQTNLNQLPKEQVKPGPIINKKPLDDEFAMDNRYSHKYESSVPITPIIPSAKQQQQQKQFKSSRLNLIDWQSMYPSSKKSQQLNPYINSSHIGLLDDQHWTASQSNSYDAASLPYPPSGMIPMSEVKYRPDDKLQVGALEKYQSQPVNIHNINNDNNSNKGSQDTFIKGIESRYFVNTNNNKIVQQQLSEDELLLREIQRQSQQTGNKIHQQQVRQQQKPKSFNKLFGMKMKIINPTALQPINNNDVEQSSNFNNQQQQQQIFPSLNLRQFLSSSNSPHIQQSIVRQLQQDQIERYLRQQTNIYEQDTSNQISQIERQMSRVKIGIEENQQNIKNIQEQEVNLNNDIKTLIERRKRQQQQLTGGQQQQQCQYHYSSDEDNSLHNQQEQQLQQQVQHHHTIYDVDNQRLDSSIIRYSEQGLCENNFNYQQQQLQKQPINQYQGYNPYERVNSQSGCEFLDSDLLDSLNIIRRHFGCHVVANHQQQTLQTKTPSSLSIKKPYMVSVYARQDYLDSLTQIKKKLSSPQ